MKNIHNHFARKTALGLAATATSILVCQACTLWGAEKSAPSAAAKTFVTNAAEGGHDEVRAGELAQKQSKNQDVKSFGEMLVHDHEKANAELKEIATAQGIEVPAEPSLMQQGELKLLGLKSGDSFDKAFVDQEVKDHKTTIAMFEKASKDIDDAKLQAFAKKTIPHLKHHLEAAEKLQSKIGK